jgi:hypothetical protein
MSDAPHPLPVRAGSLFHEEVRRLNLALAAIRKAQGKSNPIDMEPGTPEWHATVADFAADLLRHGDMLSRDEKARICGRPRELLQPSTFVQFAMKRQER